MRHADDEQKEKFVEAIEKELEKGDMKEWIQQQLMSIKKIDVDDFVKWFSEMVFEKAKRVFGLCKLARPCQSRERKSLERDRRFVVRVQNELRRDATATKRQVLYKLERRWPDLFDENDDEKVKEMQLLDKIAMMLESKNQNRKESIEKRKE